MADTAFSSLQSGASTTPVKKRKLFTGTEAPKSGGLFSGLDTGMDENDGSIGSLVNNNLKGMLSGDSYDDKRLQQRETLLRAASNLRAQSGAQNAATIGQGSARRAQQKTEQSIFQGLADNEMNMNIEEQTMKERGVGLASQVAQADQQVRTQREQIELQRELGFADLNMREKQLSQEGSQFNQKLDFDKWATEKGYTENEVQRAWQAKQNDVKAQLDKELTGMQLSSSEKIAAQQMGMDKAKLDETARQFNVSTDNLVKQFKENLNFEYSQLNQNQLQFMEGFGLDKQKFDAAKEQFNKQLEQEGKIQFANLNLKEKELSQQGSQFTSRLDFDKWATEQNLTESEKNRVWQSSENARAQEATQQIAVMQNDTERWRTERADVLTRNGWDFEAAQRQIDREQQITTIGMEQALTREIEAGRLSQSDRQLMQQAQQFGTEMDWKREATRLGMQEAEADRIWKSNERINSEVFTAKQADIGYQFQREIEEGRMNLQELELAQNASQFTDQLEWQKEAKNLDLSEADATRLWQSAENAKAQKFNSDIKQLEFAMQREGLNFKAMMMELDNYPEEQVVSILNEVAAEAGITHVMKNADGSIKTDSAGNPIVEPGFETIKPKSQLEKGEKLSNQLVNGEINYTQFKNGTDKNSGNYDNYQSLLAATPSWTPELGYDSGGFFGADKRKIGNAPAIGEVFKYDGKVYQVTSDKVMNPAGENSEEFKVIDISTGETRTIKVNGSGSKNLKIAGF